jgi:hypothetical protein
MQIIAGALMVGVLSFGAYAVAAAFGKPPGEPLLAYIAVGFSAAAFIARMIVPPRVESELRKQAAESTKEIQDRDDRVLRLAGVFQTRMILEYALLEGPCFFCLVAYIISTEWWLLAIVGVLLAIMAVGFPTRSKLENWADDQLQLLELD